jgi:hypothetical protein
MTDFSPDIDSAQEIVDADPNTHNQRTIYLANYRVLVGFREHIVFGRRQGGFVTAALENDLSGAVMRADPEVSGVLPEIVQYLNMCMPATCHGSEELVATWRDHGGWVGKYDEESAIANLAGNI